MATGVGAKRRLNRVGQGDDVAQAPYKLINAQFNKLVTFSAVGGAVEFGSTALCGLPVGDFIVAGGFLHLDVIEDPLTANISNTFTVKVSLGTVATADNSLTANEINLLTAVDATIAVASVAPHVRRAFDGINTLAGATGAAAGTFANSGATLACFLNLTLPDADISGNPTPATLRVKGSVRILTLGLGKNS